MTDDKMQPDANDRPESARPAQVGEKAQESPTSAVAQPAPLAAAGRKPLFRT